MTQTRTSRLIKARAEELYAAFMDPAALVAWLPPGEMTGRIHAFDARVGGGYSYSTTIQKSRNLRRTGMLVPYYSPELLFCITGPRKNAT